MRKHISGVSSFEKKLIVGMGITYIPVFLSTFMIVEMVFSTSPIFAMEALSTEPGHQGGN